MLVLVDRIRATRFIHSIHEGWKQNKKPGSKDSQEFHGLAGKRIGNALTRSAPAWPYLPFKSSNGLFG